MSRCERFSDSYRVLGLRAPFQALQMRATFGTTVQKRLNAAAPKTAELHIPERCSFC
jgi:hypothetical protein